MPKKLLENVKSNIYPLSLTESNLKISNWNHTYRIKSLTRIKNECSKIIKEYSHNCVKLSENSRETEILQSILDLTSSNTSIKLPERFENKRMKIKVNKCLNVPNYCYDIDTTNYQSTPNDFKSISDTKLHPNLAKCIPIDKSPKITKGIQTKLSRKSVIEYDRFLKPTTSILKLHPSADIKSTYLPRSLSAPENKSRCMNSKTLFNYPKSKSCSQANTDHNIQNRSKTKKKTSLNYKPKSNIKRKISKSILKSLEGSMKSKAIKNLIVYPKLRLPFKSRLPAGGKKANRAVESEISLSLTENPGPSCNAETCGTKDRQDNFGDVEMQCCQCSLNDLERKVLKKKFMTKYLQANNPILSGPFSHKMKDYFNRSGKTKEPGVIGYHTDGSPIYSQAGYLLQQYGDELRRPVCAFRRDGEPIRHPNDKHKITYLGTFDEDDSPIVGHIDLVNGMKIHNITGFGKIQYDTRITVEKSSAENASVKKKFGKRWERLSREEKEESDNDSTITISDVVEPIEVEPKPQLKQNAGQIQMARKYPLKYDIGDCWPMCRIYHKSCKKTKHQKKVVSILPRGHYPGKIQKKVLKVIKRHRRIRALKNPERLIRKGHYSHTRNIPAEIVASQGFQEYCKIVQYWQKMYKIKGNIIY